MMLRWAKDAPGPVAIRYPKAESAAAHNIVPLQKGDWQVVSVAHRAQAVVFAVGSMVGPAMMAADTLALEGLEVEVSGGEAKITLNGAVITVSEAGDVSITSPTKIELTAPEINATAGTGDVTIQGISLVNHTHTDSLGGSTTPPK